MAGRRQGLALTVAPNGARPWHTRVPTYIETISKRGYRLIARVQPLEGGPAMETPVPAGGRSRLPRRVAAVGALLTLLIAGMYMLQTARQQTALPVGAESRVGAGVDRSPTLPTVTVMPFDSLADDATQIYLARGITADLTTDLSRLADCA